MNIILASTPFEIGMNSFMGGGQDICGRRECLHPKDSSPDTGFAESFARDYCSCWFSLRGAQFDLSALFKQFFKTICQDDGGGRKWSSIPRPPGLTDTPTKNRGNRG